MAASAGARQVRVGDLVFDVDVRRCPGEVDAVLLHGFPQSAASWEGVSARLAAHGVSTWAPNQRGYSPGARPDGVEAYRLAELVSDVLGLCDELALDSVHLVGHDWGAVVAWAVAARHAERVASLTAVSMPHPAAFARVLAEDTEQRQKSSYVDFLRHPGTENVLTADGGASLRLGFGDAVASEVADRHIARLLQPGAMAAALNWYRAIGDDWLHVPRVSVPTTVVWGGEDIAVARAGIDLCGEFVDADYSLLVLDDKGHWLPEQAPGEVTAAILARVGAARPPR
ncbi:alpha/beta fold hydrolase [Nocardia beijingensis]